MERNYLILRSRYFVSLTVDENRQRDETEQILTPLLLEELLNFLEEAIFRCQSIVAEDMVQLFKSILNNMSNLMRLNMSSNSSSKAIQLTIYRFLNQKKVRFQMVFGHPVLLANQHSTNLSYKKPYMCVQNVITI